MEIKKKLREQYSITVLAVMLARSTRMRVTVIVRVALFTLRSLQTRSTLSRLPLILYLRVNMSFTCLRQS